MATTTRIDELLRCFPFLADLPEELLQNLSDDGQLQCFQQGQPICRVDHPPARIYLLLEGTARSVVFSRRLPRGVATLQRLQPGSVLGWTLISCGRCWETMIASSDLVVVALTQEALRRALEACPALAERVRNSVSPSELFGVLDAHLQDYPRALSQEVVEAANLLAEDTVAPTWTPSEPDSGVPDAGRLWLVASGPLPVGTPMVGAEAIETPGSLRLLGIDRQRLAAILEPAAPEQAGDSGNGWHARLLARWEQQRQGLEPAAIAAAAPIDLSAAPPAADQDTQGPEAFPWIRGVGPLESSIAAFQMLSQHLDLPFRRDMMRRVFGDQVQRHGEASLPLAGAVA